MSRRATTSCPSGERKTLRPSRRGSGGRGRRAHDVSRLRCQRRRWFEQAVEGRVDAETDEADRDHPGEDLVGPEELARLEDPVAEALLTAIISATITTMKATP